MDPGESITRWTARVALVIACAALATLLVARRRESLRLPGQILWTLACAVYLGHVAAAFHFFHHWSQEEALKWTAMRTEQVTGMSWDGGLWINYVFTAMWVTDVVWLWTAVKSYRRRPMWLALAWLGFFVFMAFNSTVVFESGTTRWIAIAVSVLLISLWLKIRLTPASNSSAPLAYAETPS